MEITKRMGIVKSIRKSTPLGFSVVLRICLLTMRFFPVNSWFEFVNVYTKYQSSFLLVNGLICKLFAFSGLNNQLIPLNDKLPD